jgi:hypothetical protein
MSPRPYRQGSDRLDDDHRWGSNPLEVGSCVGRRLYPVRCSGRRIGHILLGPSVRSDLYLLPMSELLCGDCIVAGLAQVAGVTVLIRATKGQRDDVVDDLRYHGSSASSAALTKAVRAPKAAFALLHARPTAEAAAH